jgi:hypothetical protein
MAECCWARYESELASYDEGESGTAGRSVMSQDMTPSARFGEDRLHMERRVGVVRVVVMGRQGQGQQQKQTGGVEAHDRRVEHARRRGESKVSRPTDINILD